MISIEGHHRHSNSGTASQLVHYLGKVDLPHLCYWQPDVIPSLVQYIDHLHASKNVCGMYDITLVGPFYEWKDR